MDTQKNISISRAGATPLKTLVDAMDLMGEAKHFTEAAYMACEGLSSDTRGALQQVLGASADVIKSALEKIEEVRAHLNDGGAA